MSKSEINLSFQLARIGKTVYIAVYGIRVPVFPLKNKLRYSIALRSWMITNPVRVRTFYLSFGSPSG